MNHQANSSGIASIDAGDMTPYTPVLDRLSQIAGRARAAGEFIDLFETRLSGGPSVLTPPTVEPNQIDPLPASLDELLAFIQNTVDANHDKLRAIAGRF